MIDTKYFEIPDFCNLTRECDPNCSPCNDCISIFNDPNCSVNYGLTAIPVNKAPECSCHDICVEEVVLIGKQANITKCIAYPPVGPCRIKRCGPNNVQFPVLIEGQHLQVFLWCADESINSTCNSILVNIGLVVIACSQSTTPGDIFTHPVVIPLPNFQLTFNTFYKFPNCTTAVSGSALSDALTTIDGSCIVAQFNATVGAGGRSINITGKVIDKLWRFENLWVSGIRPYELSDGDMNLAPPGNGFSSYTVKGIFNDTHAIGQCTDFCT